jgi:hypothetical protein
VNSLFNINFRRETYLRELARARQRVIALAVWVAYFGVMGLMLGLYGLNCVSLSKRVARLERQAERARVQAGQHQEWKITAGEVREIDHYVSSALDWRDRLAHLAAALPPNARVRSIELNPDNLQGPGEQNRLIIDGQLKLASGEDRMKGVVNIVAALRQDTVFMRGFRAVRLASTRTSEEGGPVAEFVIECQ